MPEFDIDAFITEVERLGLKLPAPRWHLSRQPLADAGRYLERTAD